MSLCPNVWLQRKQNNFVVPRQIIFFGLQNFLFDRSTVGRCWGHFVNDLEMVSKIENRAFVKGRSWKSSRFWERRLVLTKVGNGIGTGARRGAPRRLSVGFPRASRRLTAGFPPRRGDSIVTPHAEMAFRFSLISAAQFVALSQVVTSISNCAL